MPNTITENHWLCQEIYILITGSLELSLGTICLVATWIVFLGNDPTPALCKFSKEDISQGRNRNSHESATQGNKKKPNKSESITVFIYDNVSDSSSSMRRRGLRLIVTSTSQSQHRRQTKFLIPFYPGVKLSGLCFSKDQLKWTVEEAIQPVRLWTAALFSISLLLPWIYEALAFEKVPTPHAWTT